MQDIREFTMGVEEPSEESSLQISTSPGQIVPSVPSRALHVRKSNTKQSASAESSSRSSSARSSSRPPTGASSHRGPGTVELSRATSQELHLHDGRAIHNQDHRTFVHSPDQRTMQVNVLNQDQRSMQVNIGLDPEQVVARETKIMSQAHAAVNAARSQLESETSAMRDQVASIQHEAQSHTQSVEFRATEIVSQMQTQHARELDHVNKQIANESS